MDFSSLVSILLYRTPLFLLWFIGIVLAVLRFGRHPRVSISVILGLFILFVSMLITLTVPSLFNQIIREASGSRVASLLTFLLWLQRAPLVLDFIGWLLILFGIFADRKSASSVT